MNTERDYTPQIFTALGITSETQPWAYESPVESENGFDYWNIKCFLSDGTLEADGLAVRLIEKIDCLYNQPEWSNDEQCYINIFTYGDEDSVCKYRTFAQAVYAAMVEALNINKKGEKE